MCTQTLNRSVQDINNYLSTFQLETVQSAFLKGTVSIISSDSPCKDGNARFTTLPLIALSMIIILKTFYFQLCILYKRDLRISRAGKLIKQTLLT